MYTVASYMLTVIKKAWFRYRRSYESSKLIPSHAFYIGVADPILRLHFRQSFLVQVVSVPSNIGKRAPKTVRRTSAKEAVEEEKDNRAIGLMI